MMIRVLIASETKCPDLNERKDEKNNMSSTKQASNDKTGCINVRGTNE